MSFVSTNSDLGNARIDAGLYRISRVDMGRNYYWTVLDVIITVVTQPSLKLGHWWVISSPSFTWFSSLIHAYLAVCRLDSWFPGLRWWAAVTEKLQHGFRGVTFGQLLVGSRTSTRLVTHLHLRRRTNMNILLSYIQKVLLSPAPGPKFQYQIRHLIVRSREVSKPHDWWFILSHRFEIW